MPRHAYDTPTRQHNTYIYNAMITLSDLHLMSALSRLFVVLERTPSGAAGRRRIGTTPVHVLESVLLSCVICCRRRCYGGCIDSRSICRCSRDCLIRRRQAIRAVLIVASQAVFSGLSDKSSRVRRVRRSM
jgi:hypothetical protein